MKLSLSFPSSHTPPMQVLYLDKNRIGDAGLIKIAAALRLPRLGRAMQVLYLTRTYQLHNAPHTLPHLRSCMRIVFTLPKRKKRRHRDTAKTRRGNDYYYYYYDDDDGSGSGGGGEGCVSERDLYTHE